MSDVFLGIVVILIIAGALMAVGLRNVFHNILGLAVSLFGVAGLFLYLDSELLALMEILIYVGAISIAIVFAVMLSNPMANKPKPRSGEKVFWAAVVAGLVYGGLAWALLNSNFEPAVVAERDWSAKHVGEMLLTEYVLVFELISLVLLVAIVGSILIVKKEKRHAARRALESSGGEGA